MMVLTRLVLVLCAFVVTACSSVPLASLPKLAAVKPETMDMSQMELAVRVPEGVGIRDNSAKLDILLKSKASGETLSYAMELHQPNKELTSYLKRQERKGYKVYRYKMTEEQLAKAEAFRIKALDLKARSEGTKNEMTLNASAGFCRLAEGATNSIDMTFYIRTKSNKDFFKLFKEQSLPIKAEDIKTAIAACAE